MFGVKVWTSIDPLTSLEDDVLSEAKKKLAVGTIKISSVHPKSKKTPQIRVHVQTEKGLEYVGTLGATKGANKGVAEKFLQDNGIKMSDLPSGAKWTHLINPDETKKAGAGAGAAPAPTVPPSKPKPEPEKVPPPEKKPSEKLKKDLPEPKKTVSTKQQAAYNNIYQDAMHKADSDLSPEEKKIIDDLKYGLEGVPADADAEAVYNAWLNLHTGMTADDMEKDYGKDWSEKAWALSAALSKYKGGPGDKEWEQDKLAQLAQKAKEVAAKVTGTPPPADVGKSLEGFGGAIEMIDAAGGQSAVPADVAEMLTKKYGDDWQHTYKLSQVIKAAGGADKLAQMAATHASMAKSMEGSYGAGWQEKAKTLHKEMFGADSGALPPPADFNAPPPPPPAPPVSPTPVPTPVSSTEAPSYVPPPGGAPAADLEIPTPSNLKPVGGAESLGGAGEKKFYQDKQGNKYLFKLATKKGTGEADPKRAFVQSAFSGIAKEIKSVHPKIETVKLGGKVGAIYPFLPGGNPPSLSGQSPSDLSPSEAWDVAEEHVIDWLMSQHDSHPGNFLRTEEGRIIGIDKEQGFKYFPNDKLSIDYHPNAKYNEQEPFYNTFWRDWTKGKVSFDPQKLDDSINKAMAITPADFYKHLRPYAEARHPGNKLDQENFLREAYNRKNTLRRDFEKFFSGLYEKKTGEKGSFTFAGGWIPESEKDKPHIEVKITPEKTQTSAQMLSALGGKVDPYKTKGGQTDPSKITVKTTGSKAALEDMLTKLGIKPFEVVEGSHYRMAFVNKADWEAASVHTPEKKEEITVYPTKEIKPHSGQPKYFPAVGITPPATPNSSFLKKIKKDTVLGHQGSRITLDGPEVEGQVARVKRKKDAQGEYYEVSFKLRAKATKKITGGDTGTLSFKRGTYDADKDVQVDGDEEPISNSAKVWNTSDGTISMFPSSAPFALKGMVVARIRTSPEKINDALGTMLDKMQPGLAGKVIRDPSAEEIEVAKLSAILKAVSPQVADNVDNLEEGKSLFTRSSGYSYSSSQDSVLMTSEEADALKATWKSHGSKRSTALLRELLKGKIDQSDIDSVAQAQTLPGFSSFVQPGRWKTLGGGTEEKPKVRCISWEVSKASNVVKMLTEIGALGINERAMAGDKAHGASYGSDISSGCADGMTVRLWTDNQDSAGSAQGYGDFRILVAPDQLDRLDNNIYYGMGVNSSNGDEYGCMNPSDSTHGKSFKTRRDLDTFIKNGLPSGELVVRRAMDKSKILRVACDGESYRKQLIQALRDAGAEEVNGVPIEDFVVIAESRGSLYNKYVKPAGY